MKAMNKKKNLLQVEHLSKSFGEQEVLKDLSFELEEGLSVSIEGPSGSGKSTFLNILGTLDLPDSGTVLFKGQNLALLSDSERSVFRNKHIGFVFQMHHLLPQCTVMENVLLPALGTSASKTDRATVQRAREILDSLGMTEHSHKFPAQLSGGECQRTAFARALINQPELILADEPTGSLDQESAEKLGDELIKLNRVFRTTLIVVTHSAALAQKMQKRYALKNKSLQSLNH